MQVIDSRERNSADGNVVQKARRQVEVFQSHGVGGRSVQVFRASQWSSSRITDSTSSSPVSVSMVRKRKILESTFGKKLMNCMLIKAKNNNSKFQLIIVCMYFIFIFSERYSIRCEKRC